MAEQTRKKSSGAGWLTTLFGAGILIVLGFGVGLVAGAVFEEPDLVMDHLAGRTTVVELAGEEFNNVPGARVAAAVPPGGEPAPVAPSPPQRPLGAPRVDPVAPQAVAAAPPPAREAEPAPREVAPAPVTPTAPPVAVAPGPPPVAAAPPPAPPPAAPRSGFAIQVGAFGEQAAAQSLISRLEATRHPAYVVAGTPGERVRFRVRVGPYPSRDEAVRVAARLEKEHGLPTWVLAEDGS